MPEGKELVMSAKYPSKVATHSSNPSEPANQHTSSAKRKMLRMSFEAFKTVMIYHPREPKTAEKSNPVKKHDVSEKKTGSVKKDGFCQITHHFFTGFLRINTGFLREKYGFHMVSQKLYEKTMFPF